MQPMQPPWILHWSVILISYSMIWHRLHCHLALFLGFDKPVHYRPYIGHLPPVKSKYESKNIIMIRVTLALLMRCNTVVAYSSEYIIVIVIVAELGLY